MSMSTTGRSPLADPSETARGWRAVSELAKSIAGHQGMEALFHDLAERLHELLNFTYLSVVLYEPDTHTMRVWQIEGAEMVPFDQRPRQSMSESISARVWETQQPFIVSDTRLETEFPKLARILDGVNVRSFLSLPLTTVQRRLGALNFGNAKPQIFDTIDTSVPLLVASHVAVAVDNALHADAAREFQASLELRNRELLAERRRLEEIVREIPGIVWEAYPRDGSSSLHVQLLNDALPALLGRPTWNGAVGWRTPLAMVHRDDRLALAQHIIACMHGARVEPVVVRCSHSDGSVRWIEIRSRRIQADETDFRGMRGVAMDVTGRIEAEAARQRHAEALLAERLEERARIAADLHDTLLQTAVGSSLRLRALANGVADKADPVRAEIGQVLESLDAAILETRIAVQGLRPDVEANLETTLRLLADHLARERPMQFTLQKKGRIPPDGIAVPGIARIAAEAVTNAYRHSCGSRVTVSIEATEERMRIVVADDGIGIDPHVARAGKRGHLGILSMRERAALLGGSLQITRNPQGTSVEITAPVRV
jgi:PAS domain S-box-containing protein